MVLLVSATNQSLLCVLIVYFCFRLADITWLLRLKKGYNPSPHNLKYFDGWLKQNYLESLGCLAIIIVSYFSALNPLTALSIFIIWRIAARIMASFYYKAIYFS